MSCSGNNRPKFTQLTALQYQGTLLGGKLTNCVDKIRDLKTKLGARPYQVFLVFTRWSGGERGVGVEEVVKRDPILPTPNVAPIDQLTTTLQSVGLDEVGEVRVTEISVAYTEEELRGLDCHGEGVPEDMNFYWEIVMPIPSGYNLYRRFSPRSPPTRDAVNFQWKIDLLRASEDRTRTGDTEG